MRLGMTIADEVRDAARDDPCLTGSGPGENEQRSAEVKHGFALFWVERFQELHVGRD